MKIVFFGDSVTEGCFELSYINESSVDFDNVKDVKSVYHTVLKELLQKKYPDIQFEFINSGIRANSVRNGVQRIETDVLAHKPDAVVVCFGLNDIGGISVEEYTENLKQIFAAVDAIGAKIIYMTPNMMCKYVHRDALPSLHELARAVAKIQNENLPDAYFQAGIELANRMGVYTVDAYSEWKRLEFYGIDTTMLLSNRINHPTRAMHRLFADMLCDCIVKNELIRGTVK